jgi:hypothetical protein
MKVIESYGWFNKRRYSDPWIAVVSPKTGKIDFSKRVGGYTGGYHTGEAGDLYVTEPTINTVYAYGQKDHRGGNTKIRYAKFDGEDFVEIPKTDLVATYNEITGKDKA